MLLRISIHRRKPIITTPIQLPPPPQPTPDSEPMAPLPPANPPAQLIADHTAHHISPPSPTTPYENFLIVLIATYLLWTFFYGFYILLRIGVWLFEKLELVCTQIVTLDMRQGCVTEMWIETEEPDRGVEKMRLVDSGTCVPVQSPGGKDLQWIVRRRSGTV
ncbi:hypothetical protein CC86DRAFT_412917 [Ophiobolus disseminans]|uniref:Uncharacterized protein n=1 Tax=Ophiobolus disseminans TaxID=1469910 RepID=A0A6A6ZH29_9PLEO|nr:hypothetical protein CC86DRAFT_412917 [Ophiobolus disseminans]